MSAKNILFLSSDPRSDGRSRWEAELRDVREALERAQQRDQFVLHEQLAVRAKDIRRSLLKHQPAILHIAGKDDGEGILLEAPNGTVQPVPPAALADLLSMFKDTLQWVILSGCFQAGQASAISELGLHVLGLSHELDPSIRKEAAVTIYDSLGAGRADPSFVAGLTRSTLTMNGGRADQIHLYHQGQALPIGQPADGSATATTQQPNLDLEEAISRYEAYQCDRTQQGQVFRQKLENQAEGQFHFFAIHGDDPQSHHGLFNRFYYRYLCDPDEPELTPMYKVPLPEMNSLAAYQGVIRERLLTAMKLGRVLLKPDEQEMTEAGRKLSRRGVETVAVEFRVRSAHWKAFTPELIEWFVTDYCRYQGENDFYPVFYFFVSIIYEKEADHALSLAEIKRLIPQLEPHCHVLDELTPVPKTDILEWIDQYLSSNQLRKKRLWQRYFSENRAHYDMVEVEQRLNTLINREAPDGKQR